MMRGLITGVLFAGLMGEIAAPVLAQTHVTKVYHGRSRRSRRNRRIRNTAIGAGGGAGQSRGGVTLPGTHLSLRRAAKWRHQDSKSNAK